MEVFYTEQEQLWRGANPKLSEALRQANGRRRERLLTLNEVVAASIDLRPGQHIFLHGGHVASAYRYPAVATGAVVWIPRKKRLPRAIFKVVSASKGSTGFGREDQWSPPLDDEGIKIHEAIKAQKVDAEMSAKSWKPEVIADSSGEWSTNALRFRTEAEAQQSADDLASRWMLVTEWRASPSDDAPTHQIVDGEMSDLLS